MHEREIETIIGLEIHVQLNTRTKMFCACRNDGEFLPPNTTICPVCTGQPGTLPVPNRNAITSAAVLARALGCTLNERVKFDRKHYFYPDLPKGYQISQHDMPIGENGIVTYQEITTSGGIPHSRKFDSRSGTRNKKQETSSLDGVQVRIKRVHVEEDTAKLLHTQLSTLVDFNRSGSPLVEIVTEPDFRTARGAKEFVQLLRMIVRYLGVSDGDMEKGHIRCDVNVSVRWQGDSVFNPKTEIKNINSFKSIERAILAEQERLGSMLAQGALFAQETRGWNDQAGRTEPQRTKETAADYRYMPEPDIPPVLLLQEETRSKDQETRGRQSVVSDSTDRLFSLAEIDQMIPELPHKKADRLRAEYGLDEQYIAIFIDDPAIAEYFCNTVSEMIEWIRSRGDHIADDAQISKIVSDWLVHKVVPQLKQRGMSFVDLPMTPENFAEFLTVVFERRFPVPTLDQVLNALVVHGGDPSDHIARLAGQEHISDIVQLEQIVHEVVNTHPEEVARYRAGKVSVVQFLIGQVMRASKGKAQPEEVRRIFERLLGNEK